MDTKELMKYIQDAIDLETDIATQLQIFDEVNRVALFNEPKLRLIREPRKPIMQQVLPFNFTFANDWDNPASTASAALVGSFVCFFISLFAFETLSETPWPFLISSAFGILFLLPWINGKSKYRKAIKSAKQNNAIAQRQYEINLQETLRKNAELQRNYDMAVVSWNQSNADMNAFLTPPLNKTRALLALHYAKDIIYPKYRSLPALTSMYEYLLTGRCTELTGPHGAYNMYEDELRKDTVISQLNTVIENLEQIKQNQYMLYQQVKSINENTQVIASELRQIKGYTVQIAQLSALNAYYAALNERNTRITMYSHL